MVTRWLRWPKATVLPPHAVPCFSWPPLVASVVGRKHPPHPVRCFRFLESHQSFTDPVQIISSSLLFVVKRLQDQSACFDSLSVCSSVGSALHIFLQLSIFGAPLLSHTETLSPLNAHSLAALFPGVPFPLSLDFFILRELYSGCLPVPGLFHF